MRRASTNTQVIKYNGDILGVCLGYDCCAEHEWGIGDLRHSFGISDEYLDSFGVKRVYGIATRLVRSCPEELSLLTFANSVVLTFAGTHLKGPIIRKYIKYSLERTLSFSENMPNQTLSAAWNGKTFAIRSKNDKESELLYSLYEALISNNALIYLSENGNSFSGKGLCIVAADNLPDEIVKAMYVADKDCHELEKADEATGIRKKLKIAHRGYFACKAKWANTIMSHRRGKLKTKYPVIYWLNPMKQNLYKSGWVTVEDLELWIDGSGPIVKTS